MTDYIRREDALFALRKAERGGSMTALTRLERAYAEIRELPAADVAEVVRCKGCEYAERYERTNGTAGYYCGHPKNRFTYGERWDRVFKPVKEANDFCSYGETE
jgi:hypothetical protein